MALRTGSDFVLFIKGFKFPHLLDLRETMVPVRDHIDCLEREIPQDHKEVVFLGPKPLTIGGREALAGSDSMPEESL